MRLTVPSKGRALLVTAVATFLCLLLLDAAQAKAATERIRINWATDADIDLHVYDAAGDHAFYLNQTAIPGGQLSPDVIPLSGDNGPHEEHFTDTSGNTPLGFCVHDFATHNPGPTTVSYTITDPGGATRSSSATLASAGASARLGASPSGSVTPHDSGDCGSQYLPSINGWGFGNTTTPDATTPPIPYERMLGYYPDSAAEMVSKQFTVFGGDVRSVVGNFFYNVLFEPTFEAGLCYGYSASSMAVFGNQGADPRFQDPHDSLSMTDPLPGGGNVRDFIELSHSTQLGLASASIEVAAYTALRPLDAEGVANKQAFDQLAQDVQNGPELVVIAPANVGDALTGTGHAVVAWGVGVQNGTSIVNVYDPNLPGDDGSHLAILNSGGMQLVDGNGNVSYGGGGNTGNASDWIAVPIGAPYGLPGNSHWLLDAADPIAIITGATGHQKLHSPSFIASGSSLGIVDHASHGIDGDFSSRQAGATVGEYQSGRFAFASADAAKVRFSAHTDKAGGLIDLRWGKDGGHLSMATGAQKGTGIGRELLIDGEHAGHGLKLASTPSAHRFSLSGTTAGQAATSGKLMASARGTGFESVPIPIVLPRKGAKGVLSALDWRDLKKTLVYEVIKAGRHSQLALLKGSAKQARGLPHRYRRLLHHCARRGRRGHRYHLCGGSRRR
jgi:hypothetical protein